MALELNKVYNMDCREGLKQLDDDSIDCCITSPPYWGLRDYGIDAQIGLEKTPEEYVKELTEVFAEVRRVLKPEGTLWLNLGDSYAGSWGNAGHRPELDNTPSIQREKNTEYLSRGGWDSRRDRPPASYVIPGLKPKDLVGIPWRVAFSLQAAGWYLRQDIIWHKPNPMPESVTDRCTKAHEYVFLMSKNGRYYYDQEAIKEPIASSSVDRLDQNIESQIGSNRVPYKTNGNMKAVGSSINRNKRSVWTVTTKPFSEAHFATFPTDLITPMIKAGCPEMGVVLDPFMGAGTTAYTAKHLGRQFIGFELNPEYCKIINRRTAQKVLWECDTDTGYIPICENGRH